MLSQCREYRAWGCRLGGVQAEGCMYMAVGFGLQAVGRRMQAGPGGCRQGPGGFGHEEAGRGV